MALKTGPLTLDDMKALWTGAVDKAYRDPLLAAGEGRGLEVHSQMWTQLARASLAIDATTQEMFIRPWSGQTAAPAGGALNATVSLTIARTGRLNEALILAAGRVFFEEETTDWGPGGGLAVLTGRRYTVVVDLVFAPGDGAARTVLAVAEAPGNGYNYPLPNTIKHVDQQGKLLGADSATVTLLGPVGLTTGQARATLTAPNAPDMFVPEHVGQYVAFFAGSNVGKAGRVVAFHPPRLDLVPAQGSSVDLELLQVVDATTFAGAFGVGEIVNFANGGPVLVVGKIVAEFTSGGVKKVLYDVLRGDPSTVTPGTTTLTGASTGATAAVRAYLTNQLFVAEAGTASWRMLGWDDDWGIAVTHPLSPSGGRLAMLDELGEERSIGRAPSEDDEVYRARVAAIADVVVPNAIRRQLARTLGILPYCFREVGTAKLPGFFFDGDLSAPSGTPHGAANDAFDTDVLVLGGGPTTGTFRFQEPAVLEQFSPGPYVLTLATGYLGRVDGGDTSLTFIRKQGAAPTTIVPGTVRVRGLASGATWPVTGATDVSATVNARRFHVLLDYRQFRGFFLVGVPRVDLGDFGFAFDNHPTGFFDASPYSDFFDGVAIGSGSLYASVYHAVDTVRAGGVDFDLYLLGGESCT